MSEAPIVTFYHDMEQDCDSSADDAACRDVVRAFRHEAEAMDAPVVADLGSGGGVLTRGLARVRRMLAVPASG